MQHSQHHRHRHVGSAGVPQAVAEAVETPAVVACAQSAFLIKVRYVADFRESEPSFAALGGRPADLELAEIARKVPQPLVAQPLVVKYQNRVTIDCIPESANCRGFYPSAGSMPLTSPTKNGWSW